MRGIGVFSMGFSAALREELALKGALLALTLERVGFTCLFVFQF